MRPQWERNHVASLLVAIADLDHEAVRCLLAVTPSLATATLGRPDEVFLERRLV